MTKGTYQGIIEEQYEVHDLTLSLSTSPAYTQHDVFADTQEVAGVAVQEGGTVVLESLVVLDEDDIGDDLDIIILDSNVSIGTENSAVSITDANARQIVGVVSVAASDYVDMINNQFACIKNIGLVIECTSTSRSVFVAVVNRAATPGTFSASGVRLKLGFRQGM